MNPRRAPARGRGRARRGGHRRGGRALATALLVAGVAALACRDEGSPSTATGAVASEASVPEDSAALAELPRPSFPAVSVDAKLETYESLRLDLEAPRDPADGGGRAWLERAFVATRAGEFESAPKTPGGDFRVRVGNPARFHIVYEAGPLGVAVGGVVFLQASPFWEWATPQPEAPDGIGYTTVATQAEGVELEPYVLADQLLAIEVKGRALAPGDRVEIVYGAGPAGTSVDRYAEREARIYVAVDGDGDGVRSLVLDSPSVEVVAARPARLNVTLPTTAEPGQPVRLTVALLDSVGNRGVDYTGDVVLADVPEGLELPARIHFGPEHGGHRTVSGRVLREGIFRIRAQAAVETGIKEAESNPLVVKQGITRVLWGDLHGHSNLSDGTGTPEDFYAYARDVAALDVAALTDHDHWGMRFMDATPEYWVRIRAATTAYHEPGRFVTLLGYEWTSWLQGHRHVLYFDDPQNEHRDVLSSMDPRYQTPDELWAALRGQPALTFAHHSAGGPISTNWTFAPPPDLEPITEITSVHGSSEAEDSPGGIYRAVPGNYVRDALALGYRFGFIGSGDSHDGHPGLSTLATGIGVGGLAAISAEALTREDVLAALRARRTYATNGQRIFLAVGLAGDVLAYDVAATAEIARIDFIRGDLTASLPGGGERDLSGTRTIPPLESDEYVYVRVVQVDGGAAWSSPIYPATTEPHRSEREAGSEREP